MSNETRSDGEYMMSMVCMNCGCACGKWYKVGKPVPAKDICPNCECCEMVKRILTQGAP